MSAVFAQWQPQYAERGIATFPVRKDKRPTIKGYMDTDLIASRRLLKKFPASDAFGFVLGHPSNIVVLDIDTPDERVLADALDRHGPSPVVVRSGSGNWQIWYRWNGESRSIRPCPKAPIDILGGGFVVAPPSKTANGLYKFIDGGLDDFDALPCLAGLKRPANDDPASASMSLGLTPGPLNDEGITNDALWKWCMMEAPHCADETELMSRATAHNLAFNPPLGAEEVSRVAKSASRYQVSGQNYIGRRGDSYVVSDVNTEVKGLMVQNLDAYGVLQMLRAHHHRRDATFCVANGMAEIMGWRGNGKRLAAARKFLERDGWIKCVKPATRHTPAQYQWSTPRSL
jgi:hypothetical protein